jgi:hypothetical protein
VAVVIRPAVVSRPAVGVLLVAVLLVAVLLVVMVHPAEHLPAVMARPVAHLPVATVHPVAAHLPAVMARPVAHLPVATVLLVAAHHPAAATGRLNTVRLPSVAAVLRRRRISQVLRHPALAAPVSKRAKPLDLAGTQ